MGRGLRDAWRFPEEVRASLAEYLVGRFACSEVILTGTGTQALVLALLAAGDSSGPDLPLTALPAYGCYDIVTAAVAAGFPVLFYDVDPVTLTPVRGSLELAFEHHVRVVVAANLFGFPLDWDWLKTVCAAHGATLIEDAAQGLGSVWKEVEGGSFGDLTVLSFARGKGWTGGGGGALLVRDRADGLRFDLSRVALDGPTLRSNLLATLSTVGQWALGRPSLYGLPRFWPGFQLGQTRYRLPRAPTRIPAFCAAVAAHHADLARKAVQNRRRIADAWFATIDTIPGPTVSPCRPIEGGAASFLRLPVLANALSTAALQLRGGPSGIVRGYPQTLDTLQQAQGVLHHRGLGFPGADRLAETLFTLPTHSCVEAQDFEFVARLFAHT